MTSPPTPQTMGSASAKGIATLQPIRYASYLEAQASEIRKPRSGARTRLKLMAAGSRLLDTMSAADLFISAVCEDAGMAKGTFYIYFDTKEEYIETILRDYVGFEMQMLPRFADDSETFTAVLRLVTWYERTFMANVGILRCLIQQSDTDPTIRALWETRNQGIVDRVLHDLDRRAGLSDHERELLQMAVHSVGYMMDQSLFARHGLAESRAHESLTDPDLLIELHATLIYRAVVGRDPPAAQIPLVRPFLALRERL